MLSIEWAKEDVEEGDIQESNFTENLAEWADILPQITNCGEDGINIALYIRDFRKGPQQIYWAYLEVNNGSITLPEVAEQAAGSKTFKIPAKYRAELEKVLKTL
jgi:hypothetical protein